MARFANIFNSTVIKTTKYINSTAKAAHIEYDVCQDVLKTYLASKLAIGDAQTDPNQEPHAERPNSISIPNESHLLSFNVFLHEIIINYQVGLNWRNISNLIQKELKPRLESMFEANVKHLKLVKFNLGTKTIKLSSFKWDFEMLSGQSFKFTFDLDILFQIDCCIELRYYLILFADVKNLYLKGSLHVELHDCMPFDNAKLLSCIDSMIFYFCECPKMDYDFSKFAKVFNWLNASNEVRNLIKRFIQDTLVYPKTLDIKL